MLKNNGKCVKCELPRWCCGRSVGRCCSTKWLLGWCSFPIYPAHLLWILRCISTHIVWKLLKISHLNLVIFHHFFVLLKVTCLVTLFGRKLQVLKKLVKMNYFWHFWQFLSTQNVNVARFARNVEWDLFRDFQTPYDPDEADGFNT